MKNALDKVLLRGEPLHVTKPSTWGVPAYFIESLFTDKEIDLEQIATAFYTWLRQGFTPEEESALVSFQKKNPNLETADIRMKIWSYLDAAMSHSVPKELLNEIVNKNRNNVDSNRKRIL